MAKAQKKNTEQVCWLADGDKAVKVTRISATEDGFVRVSINGRSGRRFQNVRGFLLFPSVEELEAAAANRVPVFVSNCHNQSVKAAVYDIIKGNYRITEKMEDAVDSCRYGVKLHATRKAAVATVVEHLQEQLDRAKKRLQEDEKSLLKAKSEVKKNEKALVAFKRMKP